MMRVYLHRRSRRRSKEGAVCTRLITAMVAVALVAGTVAPTMASVPWMGFDDVPPSNIFYDDIEWLRAEGITKGCNPPANTMFCPDRSVTRGEMAAFLARALDLAEPVTDNWFTDDDASIFEADIDKIAEAGITLGCNPPINDRFCPDHRVTRQQMASFLTRTLGLSTGDDLDWFVDDDASVHETDVNRLRTSWITFGCNPPTENRFCPTAPVSREQIAAFMHRALTQPIEGAAIAIHGSTWPETIYPYMDMVGTFGVRNAGTVPLHDATVEPYQPDPDEPAWGACVYGVVTGPAEVLGNGDDVLDPGEIWDWYCSLSIYGADDSMYLEARALPPSGEAVTAVGSVRYEYVDPIDVTVALSDHQVTPGTEVTWTVTLTNPSGLESIDVYVGVRHDNEGPYTDFRSPTTKRVDDGDDVFEAGEVWEYVYSAGIWVDTYLVVESSYAPLAHPGAHTGLQYVFSDTVVVTP